MLSVISWTNMARIQFKVLVNKESNLVGSVRYPSSLNRAFTSGVPRGGGLGSSTPPPPEIPKF
jgi:galactokinase